MLSEAFQLASTGGCATGLRTRLRHACDLLGSRLGHLAQGQPRILSVRSPRATGLASSLSGCIRLTVQRCSFQHRRRSGRFHVPSLGLCVSFPARALHLSRLSPSFVWQTELAFDRQSHSHRADAAVATVYPLGNCDSSRFETPLNYLIQLGAVSNHSSSPSSFFALLAARERRQRNW